MIKEQKIISLIEDCGRALKEKGYSDFNIEKHHCIWKKISECMKEHSLIIVQMLEINTLRHYLQIIIFPICDNFNGVFFANGLSIL